MTIYVVRRSGTANSLFKIGFTTNLDARLYGFGTTTPEGIELVRSIGGGRSLEARLHKQFADKRVAGEWFRLSDEDLAILAAVEDEDEPLTGRITPIPVPDDEFSEDIVAETRFYLNELVKREWRGMGDTTEEARDRVMEACSLDPSYGFRLWCKSQEMKGVSGEVYRCLHLYYIMHLKAEGRLQPHHIQSLRPVTTLYRQMEGEGRQIPKGFGTQFTLDWMAEEDAA